MQYGRVLGGKGAGVQLNFGQWQHQSVDQSISGEVYHWYFGVADPSPAHIPLHFYSFPQRLPDNHHQNAAGRLSQPSLHQIKTHLGHSNSKL